MRKRLVLFCLILALTCGAALAERTDPARFDSTRSLTAAFEKEGILFEDLGADEEGRAEIIACVFQGSDSEDLVFHCRIDEESVEVYCLDLVSVSPDNLLEAYETINALNADERWVRFVLDTESCVVQVRYDLSYETSDSFGITCSYILRRMLSIADDAYDLLIPLAGAQ